MGSRHRHQPQGDLARAARAASGDGRARRGLGRQHRLARRPLAAPSGGCYIASKHGVIGLTKTAAIEAAPDNVRVNCVCPGAIDSPMNRDLSPVDRQQFISAQALKRFGQPEEVAEAVVWLCSDRSSFVTGASLSVDAGTTAGIVLPGGGE
jgi:NAD(P)-dependent dehydrogenase (short-subunit alcohol dehydrogenase family)